MSYMAYFIGGSQDLSKRVVAGGVPSLRFAKIPTMLAELCEPGYADPSPVECEVEIYTLRGQLDNHTLIYVLED